MTVRVTRRRGAPKRDAILIAMDAALHEWGRWVRTFNPHRHIDAKVHAWPGAPRESKGAPPIEEVALVVERAMLACKERWPHLYRAGVARYVLQYSDAGARDYCRCSERTVRERLSKLLVYVGAWIDARVPESGLTDVE